MADKPCSECAWLVALQRTNPPVNYEREYPEWYRQGRACPESGAKYEGEFQEHAQGLFEGLEARGLEATYLDELDAVGESVEGVKGW